MARRRALMLAVPLLLMIAAARPATAQMDPERRQLIQLGFNQALDGHGPLAAYAYYHLNVPRFFAPSRSLRLVVAPGYVDSEVAWARALGEKTHLGVGFAGGANADSYTEIRRSHFIKGESFRGDGMRASVSAYHDLPDIGPVPVSGLLRVEGHYAKFGRDKTTDPLFAIPEPQSEMNTRAGLRLGGKEPFLSPKIAMEISAWHEARYRLQPMPYGYAGDRRIEGSSHLFWGRALLIYNEKESAARFILGVSGGTSVRADSFSAYKLGGDLPMASEFPLSLPGYYYQELTARRYGLLGGTYIIPMSRDRVTWTTSVTAATALVEYLHGHEQRGKSHTGVGAGVAYLSHSKSWQALASYGYGVNARRPNGQGGHTLGMLVQFDFERMQVPFFNPTDPKGSLHYMLRGKTRP